MHAYQKHLPKKLLKHEIAMPERGDNVFMSLISSILGQQLSVQVARVMRQRFLDNFGGKAPSVKKVQDTKVEDIKALGLSGSKSQYIKNVADFFAENKITMKKLEKMSDEEIIELLTQIKGVGRWTVEMILIFTLGREDVFAVDDLGIQNAMKHYFKWKDLDKKELLLKMQKQSLNWSPYRSFACLHLWKYIGNVSKS